MGFLVGSRRLNVVSTRTKYIPVVSGSPKVSPNTTYGAALYFLSRPDLKPARHPDHYDVNVNQNQNYGFHGHPRCNDNLLLMGTGRQPVRLGIVTEIAQIVGTTRLGVV